MDLSWDKKDGKVKDNLKSSSLGRERMVISIKKYRIEVNFQITTTSTVLSGSKTSYGEGNGTPLQYSCLENPMDGGAW